MTLCSSCAAATAEQDRFCPSCGTALSVPDRVEAGGPDDTVGPYRLVGVIGSGASGRVWLAYGHEGVPVAIKALSPSLVESAGFLDRFRSEAQIMAEMNHPHVVRLHEYLENSEGAWVVMEYVEGSSLRAVEDHAHPLGPEQALGVLSGALSGLGYAHGLGLVHGDLKPENILVDTGGESKLADFGQVVRSGSAEPTLGGTPAYMSPESARGGPLDPRSDLYSAGVVLYEALAGRPPFRSTNDLALLRMQVHEEPPPIEHLPPLVDRLLRRSLAKDPDLRPQSADEFISELDEAARSGYGADWLARASVTSLVAATTVMAASLAGSGPAISTGATVGGTQLGGTTTGTAGGTPLTAAPTQASLATAPVRKGVLRKLGATKLGGLIGAHPVASLALAGVLVAVAAAGGVAVATKGTGPSTETPTTSSTASTPQPGTWTATGSLGTARSEATDTLLPSGSVLVAGGIDPNSQSMTGLNTAELYDSTHGSWSSTGSMTTNRFGATATLLKNGKVLVTGGANGGDPGSTLSSAELYNPTTGMWSPTGSMTTPRLGGTATLLGNGRVLVAGGTNAGSGSPGLAYLSSAELYNPASGTWTSTGSMTTPRSGATATVLGDGKVLVAGGADGGDITSFLTSAELYNPASGTWTSTGSMTTPRSSANANLLKDGRVLVAGGDNGGTPSNSGPTFLSSAELYNPASETWSSSGSMTTPRSQAAATVLQDGTVLEAGGESADSNDAVVASAEVYNPASGTWSSAGTMTMPRAGATANLLGDGKVLVAGGNSNTGSLSSAELYEPSVPRTPPTATNLAVVTCPTTSVATSASNPPTIPRIMPVAVPNDLANQLAVYTDRYSFMKLVAPSGWECDANYAEDGSGGVSVFPKGDVLPSSGTNPSSSAEGIVGTQASACVGCAETQACPLFSAAANDFQDQFNMNCPTVRPTTESVVPISASVVSFADPPGTSGSGYPSGGTYPANGVMTYHPAPNASSTTSSWLDTCTLPSNERSICTAALNLFVDWYRNS